MNMPKAYRHSLLQHHCKEVDAPGTAQANLWLHTPKRVARDESTLHSLTLSKEPLANENFAFFPLSCLNAAQGNRV